MATQLGEPMLFQRSHMNLARQTIGLAFQESDPMACYIMPDQAKRYRSTGWYLGKAIWFGHLYGKVYVSSDKVEGVAVWLPPGVDLTWGRLLRRPDFIDLVTIPPRFGWQGLKNLAKLESQSIKLHKQSVTGRPHWYLFVIGVNPAFQGQGIGGKLLQPILQKADTDGMLCYLKTENKKNLPFYERYNFKVACEMKAAEDGPMMWGMIREPASS